MAIKQIQKVNADEEMRQIIEGQERWEHDVASRLYDARQKGKEEGAEEKALAIAERLLACGVDLTTIQQTTELPLTRLLSMQKPRIKNPDS